MPTLPFTISVPQAAIGVPQEIPGDVSTTGLDITKITLSSDAPAVVEVGYLIPGASGDEFIPVFKTFGLL